MALFPKQIIDEVLQLPTPVLLKEGQKLFGSITLVAADCVEKRLNRERRTLKTVPFIPKEYLGARGDKYVKEDYEDHVSRLSM